MRYEILDAVNGNVVNTIEASEDFCAEHYPFYRLAATQPQPVVTGIPPFEFLNRFTRAERIAARALATTDPVVADFMHMLDAAAMSGVPIMPDNHDVVDGLAYLSANPANSPVLAAGRAAQLVS
jgi:hypothetical protein